MGYKSDGSLWMLSRGAEIRFLNSKQAEEDNWGKPIIPIVNGYNYLDLAWDPKGTIWAAGGNGTLLFSKDGGNSWESDPVGDVQPTNLIRILFNSSPNQEKTSGYVLGERGTLLRWAG